ncbi:DUF7289 family protein [Archaeoglobus neptunius]|uniref:DUF7289 family protein n=1 Tax=Archaeoglobus neptunius TaxID=2798580 RepID=UPI001926B008|nr:hypothetical protein [Archaeoglobus neptunius]
MNGERAVSEILGYIYIFGIVMTVLAIVFVQVNTMVEDMKRSVMSQSLEQSFKKIQYIIHSVAFGDVPSQAVEIELQGGSLILEKDHPEFIIAFVNYTNTLSDCGGLDNFRLFCVNLSTGQIFNSSAGCLGSYNYTSCTFNQTVGELIYKYKDWQLSLEAGSVFSKYTEQSYSKILYEPRILLNTTAGSLSYLVITIPDLEGNLSVSGTGRYRFVVNEGNYRFSYIKLADTGNKFDDIYIIIRGTDHGDAWCRFFEKFPDYFNLTLDPLKTGYGNCNSATSPEVRIERSRVSELIAMFREAIFTQ